MTVSNVPSSPTASTAAALTVGGQNVDFYMYQLNGNAWSAEAPVSSPLTLSGLPAGTNTLSLLGRSQYGGYLASSNALTVSWVVNPAAPATIITGAPATPHGRFLRSCPSAGRRHATTCGRLMTAIIGRRLP